MRRLLLIISLVFGLITFQNTYVYSQSDFEAGLRLGKQIAVDATIPLSTAPRLHPSIYIDDRIGVGTYFDWMFSLDGGPNGLKFFPGVGPEFYFGDDFDISIAGNVGVEYSFKFPITVGFDYRPSWMITNSFKGRYDNWGFVARFRFVRVD